MPPPLPRCSGWAYSSLVSPSRDSLPRKGSPGRPAHRPFRGMLGVHSRCGLHTRAVTTIVTVIRRLQTFRRLHACSGCFRRERSAGWGLHPLESAALSRRTPVAVIRPGSTGAHCGHSSVARRSPFDNSESRLAGRERHVERCNRLRQTFERQGADVFEGDAFVEASRNALAYQNLTILGFRA